ncbi:MAG: alkaline phosphatase [Bacteroidota bacterium]
MIRKIHILILLTFAAPASHAQPARYGLNNIHAHNDYDHNIPFVQAYALGIGSIEADVLLINDTLFVAHGRNEIKRDVLFETTYLKKLEEGIKKNHGYAYADTSRVLQLLIDIKTDTLQTLNAVIKSIQQFPLLLNNRSIRFVITGNQPSPSQFNQYPSYILFDGKIQSVEHTSQLSRIGLFSADFSRYSKWKGEGPIPETDLLLIKKDISQAHTLNRQIRFWGVPDNLLTWKIMMELGVDYINTDQIVKVAAFLQ